jgi:hypothetical protein
MPTTATSIIRESNVQKAVLSIPLLTECDRFLGCLTPFLSFLCFLERLDVVHTIVQSYYTFSIPVTTLED